MKTQTHDTQENTRNKTPRNKRKLLEQCKRDLSPGGRDQAIWSSFWRLALGRGSVARGRLYHSTPHHGTPRHGTTPQDTTPATGAPRHTTEKNTRNFEI